MTRFLLPAALAASAFVPTAHAATLLETFDGDTIATTDLTIALRDNNDDTAVTIVSQAAGDDALNFRTQRDQSNADDGEVLRATVVDNTPVSSFTISADVTTLTQNFVSSFNGLLAGGSTGFNNDGYRVRVVQPLFGTSYELQLLSGNDTLESVAIAANPTGSTYTLSLTGSIDGAGDLQLTGTNGTETVTGTVGASGVNFGANVYGLESGVFFTNNPFESQYDNVSIEVIPEPGSLALAAGGLLLLARRRR